MICLVTLVLLGVILLALFLWNRSITPTRFELKGSHILVGAKFSHLYTIRIKLGASVNIRGTCGVHTPWDFWRMNSHFVLELQMYRGTEGCQKCHNMAVARNTELDVTITSTYKNIQTKVKSYL